MTMTNKTQRLAVSGVFIALGTILSLITFTRLPFGGTVTLFSMVPVMMLGYIYGIKWGLFSGLVYGVLQAILGISMDSALAGLNVGSAILMIILDYIIAFSAVGCTAVFKKAIKNPIIAFPLGCIVAGLLRLTAHFFSGVILFGSWCAEWYFSQESISFGAKILERYSGLALYSIYSIIYNGLYMVPEIIISVIAAVVLMSVKPIRKLCTEKIK